MDASTSFPPYKPARFVELKNGRKYVEFYVWDVYKSRLHRIRDYTPERVQGSAREKKRCVENYIAKINDGLRKGLSYDSSKDADKAKRKALPSNETLFVALDTAWKAKCASTRPATHFSYRRAKELLQEYLKAKGLEHIIPTELTVGRCYEFQQYLLGAGLGNNTVNSQISHVRAMLSYLVKTEVILYNPISKVGKLPVTTAAHRYFSADVQAKLEAWMQTNDTGLYRLTRVIYYCYARPKEIADLTLRHIDMPNRQILIEGSISKTRRSQHIRIPHALYNEMVTWGLERFESSDRLFSYGLQPGRKRVGENYMWNRHVAALSAVGLQGQGYDLYSWKHAGVVNAYKAGVDVKSIQLQCRHANLNTTDIYLRELGLQPNDGIDAKLW